LTPRKPKPMTVPEYQAEVEFLLRTLEALAEHRDEQIADLAQRAHYVREHRPRGA
jgi:hypothetical protein